jgi:hypothetical protein
MRVDAATSNHVSAWWRELDLAATRQERRRKKNRRADLPAQYRIEVRWVQRTCVDVKRVAPAPSHLGTDGSDELDERFDVANPRDVFKRDWLVREQRRADDRQSGVLVSRGADCSRELLPSLDDELQCVHVRAVRGPLIDARREKDERRMDGVASRGQWEAHIPCASLASREAREIASVA